MNRGFLSDHKGNKQGLFCPRSSTEIPGDITLKLWPNHTEIAAGLIFACPSLKHRMQNVLVLDLRIKKSCLDKGRQSLFYPSVASPSLPDLQQTRRFRTESGPNGTTLRGAAHEKKKDNFEIRDSTVPEGTLLPKTKPTATFDSRWWCCLSLRLCF